ncbi:MAG: hypothetical protein GQ570_03350 [Helicobacteraceae bacterium]|nr:hypothetical protein [Helicobacteraceae bacterium]
MRKDTVKTDDLIKNRAKIIFEKVEKNVDKNKAKENKKAGRPTKTIAEKKKQRVVYYTDKEFENIGKAAKKQEQSETEFIKSCVEFFLNLDDPETIARIAKSYEISEQSFIKMMIKKELQKERRLQ